MSSALPEPQEQPQGARAPDRAIVVASPGVCQVCGRPLVGQQTKCCSGRCRAALSRRKREDREARLREKVKALARDLGLGAEDFA